MRNTETNPSNSDREIGARGGEALAFRINGELWGEFDLVLM
jgi:hypothetical protein